MNDIIIILLKAVVIALIAATAVCEIDRHIKSEVIKTVLKLMILMSVFVGGFHTAELI